MRFFRSKKIVAVLTLITGAACLTALAQKQTQTQPSPYSGVGTTPTQEDMGNLAWASGPSGKSLPAGSGTAKVGATIFLPKCSMCHGQNAQGIHWQPGAFSPVGGLPLALPGKAKDEVAHNPWVPPITSGAPFPEVIFNTIAVEMPMFRAGTLKADEVYSLTAFILFKNGFIKEDDVMNRETLPKVQMPNGRFFPDSDDVYMDMKKRGCYDTHGVCVGN